nr:ABC transporter substrate-binding protein [Paenibacillus apiarius]
MGNIYQKIAKELVYQGKIKEALALHHTYKKTLPLAHEQFQNWFDTQYWFDRFVCSPHLSIMQEQAARRSQMNGRNNLIGTGPFRLVRNDESMVVLEAFSSYFRERALLDRVEIWIVPTYEDTIDSQESTYDLQSVPSVDQDASCQVGIEGDRRTARMECNITFLSFQQMSEGVLSSPYFRQALSLILDAKHLILEVGGERAETTDRFFSRELLGMDGSEVGRIMGGNVGAVMDGNVGAVMDGDLDAFIDGYLRSLILAITINGLNR